MLNIRSSSILFLRMIGSMFMRVNSKCAHQVRPPFGRTRGIRRQLLQQARDGTRPPRRLEVVLRYAAALQTAIDNLKTWRLEASTHATTFRVTLVRVTLVYVLDPVFDGLYPTSCSIHQGGSRFARRDGRWGHG